MHFPFYCFRPDPCAFHFVGIFCFVEIPCKNEDINLKRLEYKIGNTEQINTYAWALKSTKETLGEGSKYDQS